MRMQLFIIFVSFFSFQTFAQQWNCIEYLNKNMIVRISNSENDIREIPLGTDEIFLYSNFCGNNEIVFVTESNNHKRFIKVIEKNTGMIKNSIKCNVLRGVSSQQYFFSLEFNKLKNKNDVVKYNLFCDEKEVLGEIPNSFVIQGTEKFISDFWLDLKEGKIYINLIDLSDWKQLSTPFFIIYDITHNKVLLEETGRFLFNNPYEERGRLFFSRDKFLYSLNLNTFSITPIVIKNLLLNKKQNFSLCQRHSGSVILSVETQERSSLSKMIDGRGYVLKYEYFLGSYDGDCIIINNKIKELTNVKAKNFLWN